MAKNLRVHSEKRLGSLDIRPYMYAVVVVVVKSPQAPADDSQHR